MEIRRYVDGDRAAATAMLLGRLPHAQSHWIDDLLDNPSVTVDRNLVAVDDTGGIAAWADLSFRRGLPEHLRFAGVVVRADAEGQGLGTRLHDALLEGADAGVTAFRGAVFDDEPRSLAVVERWGYRQFEHAFTSRFSLTDLPVPALPDELVLENCPDLRFRDSDAVLAMLDLAETNPERESGLFITPDMLREHALAGTPVGRLARLGPEGRPVGLIHGAVFSDHLEINYACVLPDCRRRGIATAMKQQLHLDGRAAGATWLLTTNEERNVEIRSLNTKLGYELMYGEVRLERAV
jgi:GNAT superfamily N-acetyltransferase